ncbi:hypothetical protein MSG28_015526 [Choristoneura fumiferana]|uniref:Uncharacterized protein n=1 Tax=Choristoneura fumiferana TaxID=7141 RepID=A0ACC0KB27_CHOFU|nr:hypothetical protein MSG28_015526 [Choristoneura fumiferana]
MGTVHAKARVDRVHVEGLARTRDDLVRGAVDDLFHATHFQDNHEYPWSGYRLLDRGLLLGVAFNTSPATKHQLQWEGLVRETAVLSKTTSFKIRESSGPQMKSVLRHIVSVDHRDEPIFPTRGTWVQFSSEVAGLGGGVAHMYWAGGAHVFLPLPFRPGGAGGGLVRRLGELSPAARSSNAGCLADPAMPLLKLKKEEA